MSGGFNIGSIVSMAAQVALGAATGGASLAMTMAMTIAEQVGKQVIQQVGQELGLPQSAISGALGAFDAATGNEGGAAADIAGAVQNVGSQFNLSPSQQGDIARTADSAVSDIATSLIKQGIQQAADDIKKQASTAQKDGSTAAGASGTTPAAASGTNFLEAIAQALGSAIDQQMNKMVDLSGQIQTQVGKNQAETANFNSKTSSGEIAKSQADGQTLGTLNSQLQASSQELSILENVVSTTLKSIGEAQSTIARKG